MRGDERAEVRDQSQQDVRLRCLRHVPDHAGEAARLAKTRALPEPAARPRLQDRHADEEQAHDGEDEPAQARRGPGAQRQRDQAAGHAIEEHRSRCTEQPGEPRAEHAAERLAEHPDDQPPGHTGQPAHPRPGAARRHQQPDADADLDPDHGSCRRDGVIRPSIGCPVHNVLDPPWRTRRSRHHDLRREPDRHRGLKLENAVEDPEHSERDPQHPARGRLHRSGPGIIALAGTTRAGGRQPLSETDPPDEQ